MIKTKVKEKIIKEHQAHEKDTGSAQVQIAVTSKEIDELTHHLKRHPKDKHSRRGLLAMVNKRRKLLAYLSENSPRSYTNLVKKLGLKK